MGFPRPRNLRPDYLFVGAINAAPTAKNLSIRVSVILCLLTKHSSVCVFTDLRYDLLSWLSKYLFVDLFIYLINACARLSLTETGPNLYFRVFHLYLFPATLSLVKVSFRVSVKRARLSRNTL